MDVFASKNVSVGFSVDYHWINVRTTDKLLSDVSLVGIAAKVGFWPGGKRACGKNEEAAITPQAPANMPVAESVQQSVPVVPAEFGSAAQEAPISTEPQQ